MIPYGHQNISEEDIEAVVAVLRSSWLTQGPIVEKFENALTDYCNSEYAVAVNNATAGLHLVCRVLEIGPDSLVWVSPNTFVATANCARYCGAEVDFVDIDESSYNISVNELSKRLKTANELGRLPDLLIVTHFAGQPCDLIAIAELSKEYGFAVVEDAAHALGAQYEGKKIGSCHYSDMTVFSFHPVKSITCGEGGAITTNNQDHFNKLSLLRTHGLVHERKLMDGATDGPWYYEQQDLGYNYRMSDIHAALGLSQMKRLDEFISCRRELASRYGELLVDMPLKLPQMNFRDASAWHLYVVGVQSSGSGDIRRHIIETMHDAGIGSSVHYIPVHIQPYYQALGFGAGDFPVAEQYYKEAISLPIYPGLSRENQEFVVDQLCRIVN